MNKFLASGVSVFGDSFFQGAIFKKRWFVCDGNRMRLLVGARSVCISMSLMERATDAIAPPSTTRMKLRTAKESQSLDQSILRIQR